VRLNTTIFLFIFFVFVKVILEYIIIQQIPSGRPLYLETSTEKMQLEVVQNNVNKMLNSSSVRIFTDEDKLWWSTFWNSTLPRLLSPSSVITNHFEIDELAAKTLPRDAPDLTEIPDDLMSLEQQIDDPTVQVILSHKLLLHLLMSFILITIF